ncbi:MAG: VCBS repeat-containing protein [Planctomycetota bacterium]|nr:VCBS repeat-containing protein [Planctomycetota bacterium]
MVKRLFRGPVPIAVAAFLICAVSFLAHALINPNFTPVHLTERAEQILLLKLKAPKDGKAEAEVVRALKGKAPGKTLAIDLTRAANPEQGKAIGEMIKAVAGGDGPAIIFVGKGENEEPISKLHLGGKWVSLEKGADAASWEADAIDSKMEATWAGGTDMLLKITELILKYPDTDVPSSCAGSWEEPVNIGTVKGKVGRVMAVDIAGKGDLALFVASDGGDRVFAYDAKAKKFEDISGRIKLGSKSVVATWGDFNGDARLDLASWDGKALTIWSQDAGGAFSQAAAAGAPEGGCVGLAATEAGVKGRAGLLWSPPGGLPVLLVPDASKPAAFSARPLASDVNAGGFGAAGTCLVADFDGDAIPDVIQPFAKGSIFFKGKGGGAFESGVACPVQLGEGRTGACLGDFDADGRLDVLTMAEDSPRVWQNAGGGKFTNEFFICGEFSYISKPGCIMGNACDINNDGRQDIFLASSERGAQVFFNRGFRSFGHAHQPIDIAEAQIIPDALNGQQAGVLADLNGDGLQDMALILPDGRVFVLQQASGGGEALVVRVALAPGSGCAGPVTVSARNDRMPLGAWAVAPGVSEAVFGRTTPGEVTIRWRMPCGKEQEKKFELEDKPIRFVLPAE